MLESVNPPSLRIAIVGVGGVARYAHLPAYRRLGLSVSALCDIDGELAHEVAAEFQVEAATDDARKLAERDDVDVIDIATPPTSHAGLIEVFAKAGKPMLVQKPLCVDQNEFDRISHVKSQHNPWIRLNLTGRHVSAWRKVAELLAAGDIGRPFLCTIRNRDWWDREPGRWDHGIENYIVFEMLIHHLDLCRYWFGPPKQLTARAGTNPAQRMRQANWIAAMVEYGAPDVVQILEDWTMPEFAFASGHPFEEVLINGERGVIRASSERVELSVPEQNLLRTWHLPRPGQVLPGEQLTVGWFPDSFGAAMVDFLRQVASGSGRDADWDRLVALTTDTFAAADAIGADSWTASK
jgi:predicted dehydrogenase